MKCTQWHFRVNGLLSRPHQKVQCERLPVTEGSNSKMTEQGAPSSWKHQKKKKKSETGWTNQIEAQENSQKFAVNKQIQLEKRHVQNRKLCWHFQLPFNQPIPLPHSYCGTVLAWKRWKPSYQFLASNWREQSRPHLQCSPVSGGYLKGLVSVLPSLYLRQKMCQVLQLMRL